MKPTFGSGEARSHQARAKRREHLLALFEQSGQPAVAFCREQGISKQTFYNWRHQARMRPAPAFAQVTVASSPALRSEEIRIELSSGVTIGAVSGIDSGWLAQVVRALNA
jgi:transposase-like protein